MWETSAIVVKVVGHITDGLCRHSEASTNHFMLHNFFLLFYVILICIYLSVKSI